MPPVFTRAAIPRRLRISCLLALLLLFAPLPEGLRAEKLYKYVDDEGHIVFTDRELGGEQAVSVQQVEKERAERRFFMQLRGARSDGTLQAVNQYFGPVEVRLEMEEATNIVFDHHLPASFLVPARGELPTIRIRQSSKRRGYSYRYAYTYVPGDPEAVHAPILPYRLPVPAGRPYRISQAFNGEFSHYDEQNLYAVDIPMDEGTPIHAARAGVIMDVANDFFTGGTEDVSLEEKANYVRILHDDGTMAVYAHLQLESLQFPLGTRVRRGQVIALSGNTGFSSGPHLHFVIQKNVGMKLVSIPFAFSGAQGEALTPEAGMTIAAN